MIHIKNVLDRVTPLGAAAALLVSVAIPALAFNQASAAALTERSLMVTSTVASDDLMAPDGTTYTGLTAGDPRNGAQVGHAYSFKAGTAGPIQGFTFEYCDSAFGFVGTGACAGAPTGFSALDWDGKTVTIKSVAFDIEATANTLTLTHATGISVTAGEVVSINFPVGTGIFVNPTNAYRTGPQNGTYFAHIATYATEAAAGGGIANDTGSVDDGTVTNNITRSIGIYTRVQETLNFSVEGNEASQNNGTASAPTSSGSGTSCDPLDPDAVGRSAQLKMGDTNSALVPNTANKVTSYFRLSTNASQGTAVHYSGDTLKSANHTFGTSAVGGEAYAASTEKFGIGVNTTNSTLTHLAPTSGYDNAVADEFAFNVGSVATPVVIAATDNITPTVVSCDTAQVDYMASIAPDTPAGIYQTKINYIASPKY